MPFSRRCGGQVDGRVRNFGSQFSRGRVSCSHTWLLGLCWKASSQFLQALNFHVNLWLRIGDISRAMESAIVAPLAKDFDNACILLSYCLKHCSTCKCDPDSQDDHRERERGRENRSMTTTAGVRLAAETLYKEDDIAICVLVWFDPLVLRFVCSTVRRFLAISCRSL